MSDQRYFEKFNVLLRLSGANALEDNRYKFENEKLVHLDLTSIEYRHINLEGVPQYIQKFQNLKSLILTGLNLGQLNDFIKKLENLEELRLNHTQLTSLPDWLSDMKLKVIDISNNRLTQFPKVICNIDSLVHLNISYNELTRIPDCIGKLKNLEIIHLSNNKLKEINENLLLLSIDNGSLRSLDVGYNFLTEIPPYLLKPRTNLETLETRNNLEILDLSSNKIEVIPKSIIFLAKLKRLLIGDNEIKEIPRNIINIDTLEKLYIIDNILKKGEDKFLEVIRKKIGHIR